MQHRIASNRMVHMLVSALMIVALLTASFGSYAYAAENEVTQDVTAATVTGTLTGGIFAKIWLGFAPATPDTDVTITATWDRDDPGSNGLNFFVLDENNLTAVVNGEPLQNNNVGSGGSVFQGAGNQQAVTFRATSSSYTVVVANDSETDATFTLTTSQGFFSDDSNQVVDPSAPVVDETAAAEGEEPAAEAPAEGEVTAEGEATEVTTDTVAASETPEVDVVTAVTTTTVVTETAAPETEVVATAAPVVVAAPVEVRANIMEGALPEQDDQHFLALVPEQRDGEISLSLTFDPQDSSELARRLNFWVLDNSGFQRFVEGTNASEVAIAAGNRTFSGDTNERVATFTAAGIEPYVVIVYNNSQVPATYRLVADGGVLVDDSRQTTTAQEASVGATGVTTATTTTTTTVVTTDATATADTPAATTAGTGIVGEPGGTYTVAAGDTLAIIARDIYGDYTLFNAICSFNNIADCNRIEVGQVIQLPTQAQIDSNATAPAATTTTGAAAAAATPAATAAPAMAASTETVTDTATLTETATTTTTTAAPRTTPAGTGAALPTPTTQASTTTGTGNNLIAALEENGNFTILVDALQRTGLDDDLAGAGPYTLFAPTDAAFNDLGSATVNALLRDTAQIESILLFHVVQAEVGTTDITDGMQSATLQGSAIEFTKTGAITKVQDSNIIVPDVAASNGVIQVIDKVMLPPAN